ncbi:hypothetical protein WJ0W_002779 [Paenibacillus melissococcoides]|uniref:CNNM transmembrane domain-containing protein n=1 Tax=Paenibacillus melissococcoides TaxID=2912268 RepID=A0ABM9G1Q5_9BACL|nr:MULTISPECIES: hypothetical protein [Paenibacillus]MEB9893883.1 hypothetical protein [Bacillus cereus]CAH8245544.1 hypothetical protein WJ0W_002779 [Paenibacillus melissococcoides]CAH8711261.1 hypothetical protein WDD9_002858 [Paenibacillus melissococcoides]CAH8712027.1 hypothetical protein HTL2_003159 [Paenibacillus melissococcoides]
MKFSFKHSVKWSIFIFFVTFAMAVILSVASTSMLGKAGWGVGMVIVLMLVLIGVFFDIMGLAAAAAKETPFHAMAAERVRGAKQAIYIVRNADRFSNFCNDVIGDMTGVISGSATAIVVTNLLWSMNAESVWMTTAVSVAFTGLVSALTVGGKALGKSFAIHYSTPIVLLIGKCFYFLESKLHIRLFTKKRGKSKQRKRGNSRAARTD